MIRPLYALIFLKNCVLGTSAIDVEKRFVGACGSMLIDTSDMTIDVAFDVAKNAILSRI